MDRLPAKIKEKILNFPEYRMGTHLVDLILRNGQVVGGVLVAWGDEVIDINGGEAAIFEARDVIDAKMAAQKLA